MFTDSHFWLDALERAVSTAAEVAAVYFIGVATLNDLTATWESGVVLIGGAAVASLLKSIAAYKRSGTLSPASLAKGTEPASTPTAVSRPV